MNTNSPFAKVTTRLILLSFLSLFMALGFQNCAQNAASSSSTDTESTSATTSTSGLSFSVSSPTAGSVAYIYVYLGKTYDVAQTISYKTLDATAVSGTDYVGAETSTTIAANTSYGSIAISTIDAGHSSTVSFQVQISRTGSGEEAQTVTINISPKISTSANDTTTVNYGTFKKIAMGFLHSCTILDNSLRCWGNNSAGQLGINSTTSYNSPMAVSGLTSGITDVSAGSHHTCAIQSGVLYCWGYNSYGQLGDTSTTTRLVPTKIIASGATAVASGSTFSCAIVSGAVKCWGENTLGQMGISSVVSYQYPVAAKTLTSGVTAISAGNAHVCAIRSKALYCWGSNAYGQIGVGSSTSYYTTPQQVFSSKVTAVTVGYEHTCAVHDGYVKCWGRNHMGQLGDSTLTNKTSPVLAGGGRGYSSIYAGRIHTCAILEGSLYCWGYNASGQVGTGTIGSYHETEQISPYLGSSVALVSSGGLSHSSCVGHSGTLACWGENSNGQLGIGNYTDQAVPTLLSF